MVNRRSLRATTKGVALVALVLSLPVVLSKRSELAEASSGK